MQAVSDAAGAIVSNVRAGDPKTLAAIAVVALFLMYWYAHEQSETFPRGFYGEPLLKNNEWRVVSHLTHGDDEIFVEPMAEAGKWTIKALAPLRENWVCIRVVSSKKGVPEKRAYLDTMKFNSGVQIDNYYMNVDALGTASLYWLRPQITQNTNVKPLMPTGKY